MILVVLILLNAFFAATEIAFISLNDAKIDLMAKEGNKKAKTIKKMLENSSKFLATIQIGITLAGFLSSAFASDTFADILAPRLFEIFNVLSIDRWREISIVLITLILSYFTLVFGELVPKKIGIKYAESMSFMAVGIIKFISIIALPFVNLLTFSTNIISKLFGADTENDDISEEEIRMMIDVGEEKGTIESGEKEMIHNIFELNDKIVSEIMIPRTDMYALDMDLTIEKAIELISKDCRFSRIPIYENSIDKIKGIVYIKDMLIETNIKEKKLKDISKEVCLIPESSHVDDAFQILRKAKKQIAIIIDEYGGTAGLVSMEDILEEIVGEIYDEYDVVKQKYEKIDDNNFILDGELPIDEVQEILNIDIPDGEYDTISGYLFSKLNRIPKSNEKDIMIDTAKVTYKVIEYKDNRIVRVQATKK